MPALGEAAALGVAEALGGEEALAAHGVRMCGAPRDLGRGLCMRFPCHGTWLRDEDESNYDDNSASLGDLAGRKAGLHFFIGS